MSLSFLRAWLTSPGRCYRCYKRLRAWVLCRDKEFELRAPQHLLGYTTLIGTLRVKYCGMTPDGYTVGDLHGDFSGKLLKLLLRNFDTARDVVDAYELMVYDIAKCGIDVLQACVPDNASANLFKLLEQGGLHYVKTLGNIQVWRRGIWVTR